ncbi:50S ribosomal protein L9 [Kosmotoga arenicorallina S304]|uniref:Large ribosomal subunit protein bL9 n=1 Tax=Kosmotoga arenicorallina S304 TaxID=1453497 RepID=A0A176K0R4_9BACT|nr:50S ribosomal protein L9 [Kosmotoga arenicorallina]OAA30131.1 50S ribosomal protein L9 [Kosmotoga arenicorallina S304]
MKVILLKDVPKLGKKGELKEVSNGYGRNYLIPRGLAVEATSSELAKLRAQREQKEKHEEMIRRKSEDLLKKLLQKHFRLKAKAGSSGKLFGAITSKDIAELISKELQIEFDRKHIILSDNIKKLGDYEIEIKLPGNVRGKIKVSIESSEVE